MNAEPQTNTDNESKVIALSLDEQVRRAEQIIAELLREQMTQVSEDS